MCFRRHYSTSSIQIPNSLQRFFLSSPHVDDSSMVARFHLFYRAAFKLRLKKEKNAVAFNVLLSFYDIFLNNTIIATLECCCVDVKVQIKLYSMVYSLPFSSSSMPSCVVGWRCRRRYLKHEKNIR
jgi:hypothetical protein